MKNQVKTYICDKEQGVGISAILFGVFVLFATACMLIPMLMDGKTDELTEKIIPLAAPMLISVGVLIFGICKLVSYSRMKSETEDLMRFGTKYTGTVIGIDIAGNRSSKGSGGIVKANCVVTDPDTGAERWFASRPVLGNIRNIAGMTVDIYVYPGNENNYYVDLKSARYIAPEGISRVHDFR